MTDWIKETSEYLVPFYERFPIVIVKGKKHLVYDSKGKCYLDLTCGIGVTSFGHANPVINRAIKNQLDKILHISNLYHIPPQVELAKEICKKAFKGKCFFCNSGAEANDSAIKIARIYGNKQDPEKNKILSLRGSFHGRTIATITLTGQDKYRKGFEPLLQNIEFVEANNTEELKEKFSEKTCAIFLEAIQGEGGINPLETSFLEVAKELSLKYNSLIIFDEVQTGIGRTGKYFGYQHFNIEPDIITIAKALGNGIPIGAVLVKDKIASAMPSGMHASTFGGNYISCAAGIAVMKELNSALLEHINKISGYFYEELNHIKNEFPSLIKEIRIFGLMIGIDLYEKIEVKSIINKFLDRGILTLRAGNNVLRLLPPFTIGKKEVDMFCKTFYAILKEA